jgi:hypothetical protein
MPCLPRSRFLCVRLSDLARNCVVIHRFIGGSGGRDLTGGLKQLAQISVGRIGESRNQPCRIACFSPPLHRLLTGIGRRLGQHGKQPGGQFCALLHVGYFARRPLAASHVLAPVDQGQEIDHGLAYIVIVIWFHQLAAKFGEPGSRLRLQLSQVEQAQARFMPLALFRIFRDCKQLALAFMKGLLIGP